MTAQDRSAEAGTVHSSQALLFMDPLVIPDLAEQVGDRLKPGVVVGERTLERFLLPFPVFGDQMAYSCSAWSSKPALSR